MTTEIQPLLTSAYHHWKLHQDEDKIIWIGLDRQNTSVNSLNREVLEELKHILSSIVKDYPRDVGVQPLGVVFYSVKSTGFIAGADITQFKSLKSEEQAFELIRAGQLIFQQLAELPLPTVAWIHGFCLGGGLELALACRYRMAEEDPKTKIGLPEVMLGIHPGWGGTVRLPRMIGGLKAMDLILSGRTVSAKVAKKIGIVDAVVPKRHQLSAIRHILITKPEPKRATGLEWLTNLDKIRPLLGKYLLKQLTKKVNKLHYPAPYAALDHWIQKGVDSDAAFIEEAKSVSQLLVTETAGNLVRVFGLQEKLKSIGKNQTQNSTFHSEQGSRIQSENTFPKADKKSIKQHIHVIGAGTMGGDIAAVCALKGMYVTLQDDNLDAIAKTLHRAALFFNKVLKEPYLVRAAIDRLIPDAKGVGLGQADIILEAIIEKAEAKQALFRAIEKLAKKEAIFATNTSTLPLEDLNSALHRPERLVGIHFFNPATKMPLVEVITSKVTSQETLSKALVFVKTLDKLPLLVKSRAGFLVNRLLMPYLMESMQLLDEGVPAEAIDQTAVEFGMPMGPIELMDTIGLDVCLHAAQSLKGHLNIQGKIPAKIRVLVEKGDLGKKTGRGFYCYKNGQPMKERLNAQYRAPEDLIDRLVLRIINEAMACLREGIVEDRDTIDAGMVFGAGFPPFRGGPMHYTMEQGENLLLQRLNLLVQRYGDRFQADAGWSKLDVA